MERKLVTIRTINELTPIENADNIEAAQIDGWQVVVKRGEFEANQDVAFFEVDSFLPVDERYEFLRKGCLRKQDDVEGFRLRTVKLRGAVSQGLILPLNLFPEITNPEKDVDYAEILGVVKWEVAVAAHLAGTVKGNFPSRVKKTDQERCQNLPKYFDGRFKDVPFEVTVKLDGSSCSVYHDNGEFGVCSRNLDLKEDEANSFWKVVNRLGLKEFMVSKGRNVAIQGELMGEGIQGNKEKLHGQDLFVFDVWDMEAQRHLTHTERMSYLEGCPAKHVPVLGVYPIFNVMTDMKAMITESGNGKSLNADIREGLVFKSADLVNGDIVSFKCINPNFLLKERD